jgi:hypothetical protein
MGIPFVLRGKKVPVFGKDFPFSERLVKQGKRGQARIIPIRANMVGPSSLATRSKASIAASATRDRLVGATEQQRGRFDPKSAWRSLVISENSQARRLSSDELFRLSGRAKNSVGILPRFCLGSLRQLLPRL